MSIRSKTKRRFAILLALLVLVIAAGVTIYVVRARQFEQLLRLTRDEGLEALESGQYYTALHKIGRYAQRHPEDTEALYAYARARREVPLDGYKHLIQAVALLTRVVDKAPDHLDARRSRLELLLELNYNAETLQAADELLHLAPNDATGLRAKALALNRAGRMEEAVHIAEQRNAILPLDTAFRLLTLRLMRDAKYSGQRITDYATAAHDQYPNDARFDLLLAAACALNSDQEGYARWLKAAIAHDSIEDPELVKLLASHLDHAGFHAESLGLMNRASAASGDIRLTTLLADRWMQLERWPDLVDRLAGIDPALPESNSHLLALRAIALAQLKRGDAARPIVEALARRKDDPAAAAWASLIPAVYTPGNPVDPQKQLALAEEALQRVPSSPYFADLVADAYARMGEVELSLRFWRQAADQASAWSRPHLRMARTLLAGNRQVEGIAAIKEALRRSPEDPQALSTVATFAAAEVTPRTAGQMEGVLKLLDHIETLAPDRRDVDPVRILCLAKGDRVQEAKTLADDLLRSDAPVPEESLLILARLSGPLGLDIEARCIDRARKDYGLTPQLASLLADTEHLAGRTGEGRAILEDALAKAAPAAAPAFRLELVRYLERVADPDAGTMWITLADASPDNTALQWEAFYAPSVKADRGARDRLITRLTDRIGPRGVAWRVARAQWTLETQSDEAQIVSAASLLAEAVRIAPEYARARVLLAECMKQLKNDQAAIDQLVQAAEIAPAAHDVALRLGELLVEANDLNRARIYAWRVLNSADASPDQARSAALLLADTGDTDGATASLKQTLTKNPQDGDTRLRLAQLHVRRGEHDEVDRLLPDLLATPDEEAIGLAISHYLRTGRQKEAADLIARLETLSLPATAKSMIKADYFIATGDEDQAMQQLQLAVETGPESINTWRALMLFHLARSQTDQMLDVLERAAARLPNDKPLATLAQKRALLQKLSDDSLAVPVITAMVRNPDQAAVLGQALEILAQDDGKRSGRLAIVEKLRPLADSHPRMVALHVLWARSYLAAERPDDATQIANRLLHLHPDDAVAAQAACGILTLAQKWEELLVAGRQWRAVSPASQLGPALALARGYLNLGLPARALEQLRPYLSGGPVTSPQQVDIVAVAAKAHAAMDRPDLAKSLLEPLLKDHEAARSAWVGIAGERLRDYAAAASWLNRASEAIPGDAGGEQLQLAHAWYRLAIRSGDPQHKLDGRRQLETVVKAYQANQLARPEQVELLGMLWETAGDRKAAEFYYRRALELSPDLPVSANNLAMILLANEGNAAEAVGLARRAVDLSPDAASYHDTLGLALIHDMKPDQAATSLARAVELEPRNGAYSVSLADALVKANRRDDARAALTRLERQNADLHRLPDGQREHLQKLRTELGL